MELLAKTLWIFGSSVILGLGLIHLIYTLFTPKLNPKKDDLMATMKSSYPRLTNQTTMWKAWVGFNCSHSTGAMFFGLINIYLVIGYYELVETDKIFIFINLLMAVSYYWLARKYWFRIPLIGITITLLCYATASGIILFY